MIEQLPSSVKKNTKQQQLTGKTSARELSKSSRNSSTGKFLKRKPDLKQILNGPQSKRKRQSSIHDYYEAEGSRDAYLDNQKPAQLKIDSQRYINDRASWKASLVFMDDKQQKVLESVRSESNLNSRKKSLQIAVSNHQNNKIEMSVSKEMELNMVELNLKKGDLNSNTPVVNDDYAHFGSCHQITSKKSRTQFFNSDKFHIFDIKNDDFKRTEACEPSTARQNNQLNKQCVKIKGECQSYIKRNKRLQQEIDLYMEREYLLQTEKNHLVEVIKEKNKAIDYLQKEKGMIIIHYKEEMEKQAQKWRNETEQLKKGLLKEGERINNLKEENEFISEELTIMCQKYNELQNFYYHQQRETLTQLDSMKQQMRKPKQLLKEDLQQLNEYYQQRWKDRLLKLQEQVRYLTIQNQCQLIFKDQLRKVQSQNRRLRDERDYFKKKILESVKRNQKSMSQASNQDNSLLFQLSDISVESSMPE